MFIKVTTLRDGRTLLLNTAAVAFFFGEPDSHAVAHIAEPYRKSFNEGDFGDGPNYIILAESVAHIKKALRQAGELE